MGTPVGADASLPTARKPATKFSGVRAKRGWIETKKYDKAGRVRKVRQHVVTGLAGAFSGKEMEHEMAKVADETGASHDQIRIETYEQGEAPITTGRPLEHFYPTEQYRSNWDRAFSSGEGQTDCRRGERDSVEVC